MPTDALAVSSNHPERLSGNRDDLRSEVGKHDPGKLQATFIDHEPFHSR
jgi:hypothetical protein